MMVKPVFSLSAKTDLQGDQAKQSLIQHMEKEKAKVMVFMENFYNQTRRTEASHIELCQNVIKTVDSVLAAGDWDDSLFLRNAIKPLRQIRDEAQLVLGELKHQGAEESFELPSVPENRLELYVSLYQAEGYDLRKWAAQLDSLPNHMVGRPVYADEDNVKGMIRKKSAQAAEAYVVIEVDQDQVIPGVQQQDRLGSPLVALMEGAVSVAHIREFVHMGQRYYFKNHRLVPKDKVKKVA